MMAALAESSAHAGSLNTDVEISIPSVIALYCFDEIDVGVTPDAYVTALGRNGSRPMPSLTRTARGREGRLIVNRGRNFWNRGRFRFRTRVNLLLNEVCAYRAIGAATGARVTIEALEPRLETANSAFIQVDRVRARDSESVNGWRRTYRVNAADLGIGVVRGIDVRMRLDMRNATEPGTYSSLTDGTFRITVIGNP